MTEEEYYNLHAGDKLRSKRYNYYIIELECVVRREWKGTTWYTTGGACYNKETLMSNFEIVKDMENTQKEIKIDIPEGYEIDKENSTFECIKFKKIEDKLPRSWEEYLDASRGENIYMADINGKVTECFQRKNTNSPFYMPKEEMALAISAFCKLVILRDAWVGDWEPDWNDNTFKYLIENYHNEVNTTFSSHTVRPLAFPTQEMRDKFLDTFKDLIKQAKMFI